jgi:hypothetical protein
MRCARVLSTPTKATEITAVDVAPQHVVKPFGRALRLKLSTIEKLIADSERPALRSLAEGPRSAGGG